MFGRTRARLSLLFNRKAIITHRYEKLEAAVAMGRGFLPWDRYECSVVTEAWAEASPAGKGLYTIAERRFKEIGSKLYKFPLESEGKKILYTRAGAIAKLKSLEKEFEKYSYGRSRYERSRRQPFKKRIYTNFDSQ